MVLDGHGHGRGNDNVTSHMLHFGIHTIMQKLKLLRATCGLLNVYYLAFVDVSSPGFCHGHGA